MKPAAITGILLLLIFILRASGQTTGSAPDKNFSVGILLSPDYSYRHLYLGNDEFNLVQMRNETESPRLGFTTGVVARYRLKKRWIVESGIQFSDKGNKYEFDDFVSLDDLISPGHIEDPLIPEKITEKYHYSYWGIPAKLNYYFFQKKINMFVSAGVSTDFFLSGKRNSVIKFRDRTEKETSEMDEDFNKVSFSGLAGFGMETRISNLLQLQVAPVFRYSFTPLVDAPLKEHPWSFGLNVSVFTNL
jgi:hypothetical protein